MTTPNPLDNPLDDDQQRIKALSPSESFIVEAPAGSGKTGLSGATLPAVAGGRA